MNSEISFLSFISFFSFLFLIFKLNNEVMKKTYIAPFVKEIKLSGHQMIATSITGINGDSGFGLGDGDAPFTADSKGSGDWDIWGNGSDSDYDDYEY